MHLIELTKLTCSPLSLGTEPCERVQCLQLSSSKYGLFKEAYTVLSGIYHISSISHGDYSEISMYNVHAGRYSVWFNV